MGALQVLPARVQTFLARPELLDLICAHTANGGSLLELCRAWALPYSDVNGWLYDRGPREARYLQALSARGEWMTERWLKELRDIGTLDIRAAFDDDGRLKPVAEIPQEILQAVSSIDVETRTDGRGEDAEYITTKRLRFHDKLKALELIAKRLYLFPAERGAAPDVRVGITLINRAPGEQAVAVAASVDGQRVLPERVVL